MADAVPSGRRQRGKAWNPYDDAWDTSGKAQPDERKRAKTSKKASSNPAAMRRAERGTYSSLLHVVHVRSHAIRVNSVFGSV